MQIQDQEQYFVYGERELAYLKSKDVKLGKAIDEIGMIRRAVIPDLFTALVKSVVGQQISTKAQETVWQRVLAQLSPITPAHICALPVSEIQSCGLSHRKVEYIKAMAEAVECGELDLVHLQTLPDDAVCKRLSELKGIGVWTAEMVMIFSMQREDILSWGDMAILRGIRMLYRHKQVTPALFARYKKRYSPYATVASLYLWAISQGACAGLTDPAAQAMQGQKKSAAQ